MGPIAGEGGQISWILRFVVIFGIGFRSYDRKAVFWIPVMRSRPGGGGGLSRGGGPLPSICATGVWCGMDSTGLRLGPVVCFCTLEFRKRRAISWTTEQILSAYRWPGSCTVPRLAAPSAVTLPGTCWGLKGRNFRQRFLGRCRSPFRHDTKAV
jgi:hypothetical protein